MALIQKICSLQYVNCTEKLIRVHFNKHNIMEVIYISFFAQRTCRPLAG